MKPDKTPSGTDKRIHIAMATPRYFPYTGGVENHVYQVASRLVQQGMLVTVLTTDPSGKLPPSEMQNGIQIRRVRAWPRNHDYYFAPEIYQLIFHGEWDLIHVQSYHTFVPLLAMSAAFRSGIPYVLTFHGGGHSSVFRHAARPIQRLVLRPLLARAARLIALTKFEVEQYGQELTLSPEFFITIPNGADLPKPDQLLENVKGDGALILSVGRLEKYKGHQRAITALPYVLESQPDVRLRIVGTGPYEKDLLKLAQELGVADKVMIGGIPPEQRQEMARLVSSAALVVLLSDFETHPLSALEALSLKRPVLVADNSGMKELAERGWARTVPTYADPAEIAEAILKQLCDPLVPEKLDLPSWDDCAQQLQSLYLEVLNRKSLSRKS
jgi:glycosyltransferase involved in cell wall biosynthesis